MIDYVTAGTVAALDAAEPEKGPPADALVRLLDASWRALERYPFLGQLPPLRPDESHDLHRPIIERFERLIRRGERAGAFDRRLTPSWLVAALIGLAHTAGREVAAGRMTAGDAHASLRESVLRVFGVERRSSCQRCEAASRRGSTCPSTSCCTHQSMAASPPVPSSRLTRALADPPRRCHARSSRTGRQLRLAHAAEHAVHVADDGGTVRAVAACTAAAGSTVVVEQTASSRRDALQRRWRWPSTFCR